MLEIGEGRVSESEQEWRVGEGPRELRHTPSMSVSFTHDKSSGMLRQRSSGHLVYRSGSRQQIQFLVQSAVAKASTPHHGIKPTLFFVPWVSSGLSFPAPTPTPIRTPDHSPSGPSPLPSPGLCSCYSLCLAHPSSDWALEGPSLTAPAFQNNSPLHHSISPFSSIAFPTA